MLLYQWGQFFFVSLLTCYYQPYISYDTSRRLLSLDFLCSNFLTLMMWISACIRAWSRFFPFRPDYIQLFRRLSSSLPIKKVTPFLQCHKESSTRCFDIFYIWGRMKNMIDVCSHRGNMWQQIYFYWLLQILFYFLKKI